MTQVAMMMPILPGKTTKLEEFAKTLTGPRKKEFAESEKLFKTSKESWFVQNTSAGDMCIVYAEMKDPEKNLADWMASKRPFELWLKEQIKDITGVDFNNPPSGGLPRQILQYG